MRKILTIAAIHLLLATSAFAIQDSRPSSTDSRLRTYVYRPDEVYTFTGHYRYQSIIELESGESINSISIGDSTSWNILPSGSRMFLKPIDQDATTNMTVLTNKRIYFFELHADEAEDIRDSNLVFIARFLYPDTSSSGVQQFTVARNDDIPDLEDTAETYNFNYTITGAKDISPIKIFDDTDFTYFEFKKKNADLPAIFTVDEDGNEALINFRLTGNYVVVEQIAHQFTLRYGKKVVCVFNEDSPFPSSVVKKPKKKRKKFLGIF